MVSASLKTATWFAAPEPSMPVFTVAYSRAVPAPFTFKNWSAEPREFNPVPPLPTSSVPATVIEPVVATAGVKPVLPNDNSVTPPPPPPPVELMVTEPLPLSVKVRLLSN